MAPGAGVLVLGRGRVGHMVKVHCFFKNLPGIKWTNSVDSCDSQGGVCLGL